MNAQVFRPKFPQAYDRELAAMEAALAEHHQKQEQQISDDIVEQIAQSALAIVEENLRLSVRAASIKTTKIQELVFDAAEHGCLRASALLHARPTSQSA